ncbi:MAG: hypothetical protein JO258_10085 [Alphaproteobacteria bacterium]|nr:hypothetical protein [Alphaproteobacteria bacterium]
MLVVKPNPRRMRYMRDSASEGGLVRDQGILRRLRWDRIVFAAGLAGAAIVGVVELALHY